jgi:two-component system invasion response regulator UvrY
MEIDVALVDDHHLMRSGLASTVNGLGGYHVVIEAGHGGELVDAINGMRKAGQDLPKIAIVDLHMPVMDGYDTIAWLRNNTPEVLPLALTMDGDDGVAARAVHQGARGFLLKTARPALLKLALDSLALTGFYYSDKVDGNLRTDHTAHAALRPEKQAILAAITPRELELLQLVCDPTEPTYEQIGHRMGISVRTVENHRVALFEKFNIKSKAGLVLFAVRWGLVELKP